MSNKGVTIYFVRHGETYLNFYGRMQGWANAPLTDNGIENVKKSGRGIADVKFDAIYTSDLTRTQDTAKLLLGENKVTEEMPLVAMPEFREVFFGSYEGEFGWKVYQEIAEFLGYKDSKELFRNSSVPERMNAFKEADRYHDAEDFMTFWSRVEQGLIKLIEEHRETGKTILLVAHGGTIRYILQNLIPELGDPDSLLNASVSVASYYDGRFHLKRYGDVSHFTD